MKKSVIVLLLILYYSTNVNSQLNNITKESFMKVELKDQPFVADYYYTPDSVSKIGVIVIGGSEGGKPYYLAEPLAEEGFSVLSLAYFKEPTLPDNLELIPLEYFTTAINWFKRNYNFEKIIIVGISKGAELSLLLATNFKNINGVIAYSPSAVVFEGFCAKQTDSNSSWMIDGTQVPFVPFDVTGVSNMNDYYAIYKQSLTQTEIVEKAAIKVEEINGPILLFSGTDDKMWPSGEMSEMLVNRLTTNNFHFSFKHISFEGAGHVFSEYYTQLGGTADSNKTARLKAMEAVISFFADL
jgi:dienelactone hydrolase